MPAAAEPTRTIPHDDRHAQIPESSPVGQRSPAIPAPEFAVVRTHTQIVTSRTSEPNRADSAHRDRVDQAEHADADDEQAHQALHGEDGVETLLLVGPLDVGALDVEGVAAGAEGVVHRQRRAVDGVVVGRGRRTGTRALDRDPQLARGVGGCSRRRRQRRPRQERRRTPRRGWPSRCRPPRRRGGRRRWSASMRSPASTAASRAAAGPSTATGSPPSSSSSASHRPSARSGRYGAPASMPTAVSVGRRGRPPSRARGTRRPRRPRPRPAVGRRRRSRAHRRRPGPRRRGRGGRRRRRWWRRSIRRARAGRGRRRPPR